MSKRLGVRELVGPGAPAVVLRIDLFFSLYFQALFFGQAAVPPALSRQDLAVMRPCSSRAMFVMATLAIPGICHFPNGAKNTNMPCTSTTRGSPPGPKAP